MIYGADEFWEKCYSLAYSEYTQGNDSLFTAQTFPEILTEAINNVDEAIRQNEEVTEEQKCDLLSAACAGLFEKMIGNHFKDGESLADPNILKAELTMLRRAFSKGGTLEGIKIDMPSAARPNIIRLMSVIHLSIKEPQSFQISGGLQKFLASLDILRRIKSEEACNLHKEICKHDPALSLGEVMNEIRSNFHSYIDPGQLPRVQSRGGLAWLKANGADIDAISDMCGEAISVVLSGLRGLDLEPFSRLSRLTLDCIGHVEEMDGVSEKTKIIRNEILKSVLVCDGMGDKSPDYEWVEYIQESYRPGDEKGLDAHSLVTLVEHMPEYMLDAAEIKSLAVGQEDTLKSAIQDICSEKARLKVVERLGIEHVYTSNEVLCMRGHQFGGELGL